MLDALENKPLNKDSIETNHSVKDKQTFEFTIAGLPYRLKSSHDEATVQNLVDFVDQKINQAMQATKKGSLQSAAVLAALNIAEELILLKRKAAKELAKIEEKAHQISSELEHIKSQK
jgi:cell division protein ZapA